MTYVEKASRAAKMARWTRKPHYWYSSRDGWMYTGWIVEGQAARDYWDFCDHMDEVYGWEEVK